MSHLSHEVCGCDFFLSYSRCNQKVVNLVDHVISFLRKNQLSYFTNYMISFSEDYMKTIKTQIIRSKIFLFFVDSFSMENEFFLYNFIYAHTHSAKKHLPILIPIVFDQDFNTESVSHTRIVDKRLDLESKQRLVKNLLKDCLVSIRMSKASSTERVLSDLTEMISDIIPLESNDSGDREDSRIRHVDNFRPLSKNEEIFFEFMDADETFQMNRLQITNLCTKMLLPKEKVFVALSIRHADVEDHIKAMLDVQCHLISVDVTMLDDDVNYFTFLWTRNYEKPEKTVMRTNADMAIDFNAQPPSYLIFFDMNTAQMAEVYSHYTTERNWTVELIDSYISRPYYAPSSRVKTAASSRTTKSALKKSSAASTVRSHEDITYIAQFKYTPGNKISNKLDHSIIDTRFNESLKEMTKVNYQQMHMPIRSCPVLMNVNTVTNKHLYFTTIYKPIDFMKIEVDDFHADNEECSTPLFSVRRNMTQEQLLNWYKKFNRNDWRLIDLKAYKEPKTEETRFAAIWTREEGFCEGTTVFFVGLTRDQLANKVTELSARQLHPKLITNHGHASSNDDNNNKESGEHVYAVLFCQF